MQFFIILLLLGSHLMLSRSRPSSLAEENDSETVEADYEGNDDAASDDYLREDQETNMDEAQQKSGRHEEVLRETQDQGESRDFDVASDHQNAQDKYRFETFAEHNSGFRKDRQRHGTADSNSENDYPSEKKRPRNPQQNDEAGTIVPNEIHPPILKTSIINQMKRQQSDSSINGRSVNTNPEYGEMLFKMKPAQINKQQNCLTEEAGEHSRMIKQFNNMHSRNRDQENTFNYERERRHAINIDEKQIDSSRAPNEKEDINITNESNENAIMKNIKKLSDQDLEELLNSLPEDKKALLKKIMDKREITKKAGAIDESSFLEGGQADTSKLEGGYSVYCTESSVAADTRESSKQPESSEITISKTPDSDSRDSSKAEIINNTDMKNDESAIRKESEIPNIGSKNNFNLHADSEEMSKNENKRETNNKDLTNEKIYLEDAKVQDYPLEIKDSNDFPVNQEDLCSENEDWQNEPQESNSRLETYKREISQKDSSGLQDCVKSLKDSFPVANTYEDNVLESEMAPLVRVKRTEKEHYIKKRDLSVLPNAKVHFSSGVESENEEKNEFDDYGVLNRASNFIRNDDGVTSNQDTNFGSDTQCRFSQFDRRNSALFPSLLSESQKKDKMSLGSDTDRVISGIEGVDDNLMYNSGLRGKRTPESSIVADKLNLNRCGRTAGPMIVDVVSDNSINVSLYQDDEAFGPVAMVSEEDVSRLKRVRQVKQDTQK